MTFKTADKLNCQTVWPTGWVLAVIYVYTRFVQNKIWILKLVLAFIYTQYPFFPFLLGCTSSFVPIHHIHSKCSLFLDSGLMLSINAKRFYFINLFSFGYRKKVAKLKKDFGKKLRRTSAFCKNSRTSKCMVGVSDTFEVSRTRLSFDFKSIQFIL